MSKSFPFLAILAICLTTGCTQQVEQKTETTKKATPSLSTEALARLEQADQLDGATDHVIGKCYVCALGMDGSDKFAVQVDGYTAHLCSKICKHEFETATEKIVLETSIPESAKKE